MLIDNEEKYKWIWNQLYEKLKFKPSCSYRGHFLTCNVPFEIKEKYAVYGIENMTEMQIEQTEVDICEIFCNVTECEKRLYALDWQHSAFLYDPRNKEEQKSIWKEDNRHLGGGYQAYFPSFYPDGDYYFFIEESFEYGYLGHPWRQEIWVFGDILVEKIDEKYKKLGWKKIN